MAYFSALCVVLLAVAVHSGNKAKKYENILAQTRLEYVLALGEYTDEMSALLKTAAFSSSDETLMSCAEEFGKSSAALRLSLSFLTQEKADLNSFCNGAQACLDTAYSSLCKGQSLVDGEREKLLICAAYSDDLSGAFSAVAQTVLSGECALCEGRKIHEKAHTEFVSDTLTRALLAVGTPPVINGTESAVATLGKAGGWTESLPGVTRDEAAQIAAEFCGIAPVLLRNGEDLHGKAECYRFEHGSTEICITKRGGLIYSYVSNADTGKAELDFDDAIERAGERLSEFGYSDFEYIKSFYCNNTVTFVFAARSDGVVCLADTVLISVSLVTGRIVSLDAAGYIENYRRRTLPEGIASERQAIAVISQAAQYISHRLIFDENDTLCYEVLCRKGSVTAKILLDAVTLEERKIFLLPYE